MGEVLGNQDHDTVSSQKEIRRALELDPSNAHARFFTGLHVAPSRDNPTIVRSRTDSAMVQLRRGLEMDPLGSELLMGLGYCFQLKGNLDSAYFYFQRSVDITPSFALVRQALAQVYLQQHQPAKAISELEQAAMGGGARDSARLAYGYASARRRREAEAILGSLLRSEKTRYVAPVGMAVAYAALGDRPQAAEWLRRAETDNDPMLETLDGPEFDSMWTDPRYKPLMQHLHEYRWGTK